ncbi:rhodopsin 4 isoform 1-T4 [Glossina fuscipes fuscipes]
MWNIKERSRQSASLAVAAAAVQLLGAALKNTLCLIVVYVHSRNINLLDKINNIDENCSEDDQEVYDIDDDDDDDDGENYYDLFNSDADEKNILNTRRGQKRKRFIVSSESENEEEIETAMDGTVWKKVNEASNSGRTSIYNIFKEISGPTGYAKRNIMKGSVKSAFALIIDHKMIERVREYTESEALHVLKTKWNLSVAKLYAFIGLLYARGAYEAKNINLSYLWNAKWGPSFFSTTMSRNDFTEIMRFIRFDNKNQRSQRLQNDKFALISNVWYKFMENSENCYKPGAYLAIDEQLFPTKARCRFTQYMPNKPDKFGIKFWLASDVTSKYIVHGFPYLGKDEGRESSIPLGEFVTLKLAEPYTGHGRNIIVDNSFTSESLASKLLAKRTTLIGNIRRNKTDVTDQMARKYSVKSKCQRWPLQVFFNILDLAGINAWILYKETTGEEISRQEFLFQLAEELGTEYQKEKEIIKECSSPTIIINTNTVSSERRSCQIRYCKVNKTNKTCRKCKKYVCGKCAIQNAVICKKCDENAEK